MSDIETKIAAGEERLLAAKETLDRGLASDCPICHRSRFFVEAQRSHSPGTYVPCPELRTDPDRGPERGEEHGMMPDTIWSESELKWVPRPSTLGTLASEELPSSVQAEIDARLAEAERLSEVVRQGKVAYDAMRAAARSEAARSEKDEAEWGEHAAAIRPAHYKLPGRMDDGSVVEVIDIIESLDLGFCLGNSLKYLLRSGRKGPDVLEDLKKAQWYLQRHMDRLEKLTASQRQTEG